MKATRPRYLSALFDCWGVPYLWGGDDPDADDPEKAGLDCSGLVTYAIWKGGGPDWRRTHTAQRLWDVFPETIAPKVGDLAFYGLTPLNISHVMVWLGGTVYGASGGNRDTVSVELAEKLGARVKLKASHLYRPDWRGFCRIPFDGETDGQ